MTVVTVVVIVTSFSKNNLTSRPQQPMRFSQGSFCNSRGKFLFGGGVFCFLRLLKPMLEDEWVSRGRSVAIGTQMAP